MGKFLENIRYVAWGGLAIATIFAVLTILSIYNFPMGREFGEIILRWTHVLAGIMWIGHLYYFNFTQIPNVPKIPEEHRGPAISKVIAPAALFWFRWGAVATLVTGIALAAHNGYLLQAYTLGAIEGFIVPKHIAIGIGMWLATIMFINVWFVIWPNQKIALGIVDGFDAEAKKKAGRTAMLFSRTNTFLSFPMLVAMTAVQTLG